MKWGGLIAILLCLPACNSTGNGKVQAVPSSTFNNKFKAVNTKMRINALARQKATKGLTPEQESTFAVLKNGGNDEGVQKAIKLTKKKYQSGLTDDEAAELKYLKKGIPLRQAELQIKANNKIITDSEQQELTELKFGKKTAVDDDGPLPQVLKHDP